MSLFSTVYQDYKLFSFSLKDNIALSLPVDEKKIQRVLERVGLSKKLVTLPKGMDTMLFKILQKMDLSLRVERGRKSHWLELFIRILHLLFWMSQRLHGNPRAEYEMYRNFNEVVKGKTAVYISHRMSSTRFCDKVVVLDKGKLVEYGTHNELMEKDGLYKELFDMQAQYYKDK